ncbi:UNVERIFIED_CONTAM: hypothetical protein H355_008503, partial [Colinus virginianus]
SMITASENYTSWYGSGYGYALALFFVVFSQTLLHQLYQRNNMLTAIKIKTAVVGLIYKKALTLANSSRRRYTTGEMVNLMSADAQQLMELTVNINLLWSAPFQIIVAVIFLWKELGPSVLAGVAVLLLVIPINALIAAKVESLKVRHFNRYNKEDFNCHSAGMKQREAVKLCVYRNTIDMSKLKTNSIKNMYSLNIPHILLFSFPYCKMGTLLSFNQKRQMKYSDQQVKLLSEMLHGIKVSLATFGVYFFLDKENVLTATKVFTSISLFNILRLPLFDLPSVISAVAQTKVSLIRLEDFLFAEDLNPEDVDTNYSGNHAVEIIGASFCWEKNGLPVLKNLTVSIPEGSLVAVVGQVGSGKSSFLSALLGEMEKLEGSVHRRGSVAYLAQQAWIQNGSLQENILFGTNLNRSHYELVLESCALLPDLEQLPNGDQTEIGERGVNISGGQKQRVSLARAVYSNADLYLLDDPLSAVDVHVGKHLFEKLIGPSGLLRSKTRVLVTHNLTILPHADLIIVMEEGKISEMGNYQELVSKRANFVELTRVFSAEKKSDKSTPNEVSSSNEECQMGRNLQQRELLKPRHSLNQWKKLRNNKEKVATGGTVFIHSRGLLVCCGAYVLTRGSLAASRTLHHQLLDSVLHLPLQHFEMNPVGQIINRFTKDLFIVDIRFHYYLRTWLNCTLDVIGTILVITFSSPLFIVVVIPLGYMYFIIQRYYIASSRQIRRLAGASHSPVISHFTETILGGSTIRAFGHQERFIRKNNDVVYENLVYFYNNVISNSAGWKFSEFFCSGFINIICSKLELNCYILQSNFLLQIIQSLNFWVRKACEIETNAVSIERVCEYANMDKEKPWITSKRPPAGWPDRGIIEFVNYKAQYRKDLGLALNDISFQTRNEEKVGIVGRTGAGKSTLTNCLFRILEGSGGKIIIDGIDILTIGLHDLRGNLNIIPQDPVLFSGTLQSNLDPLGKHSDHELWEALELCDLKSFVESLPKKLLHEISEGGKSQTIQTPYYNVNTEVEGKTRFKGHTVICCCVGQRQLVCLARVLLRKTKVLVLDEATASIDMETDNLVQSTIKREFYNCTILTIAHRLHTVMDSERVLVLDAGRILEYDAPQNLLQRKGAFSEMVAEAGITR